MKLNDLVDDCIMTVEMYAKMLYNWERHDMEQKQTKSDINKNGGYIKTFQDEFDNQLFILRSTSIPVLPKEYYHQMTDATINILQELIKKYFYFCAILPKGVSIDSMQFPDEVWLTLDEATLGAVKYLEELD